MKTKIDLKFEEDVYRKFYALVYTTCKRFLVEKTYLEDAIQSVFLLYIKKEDSIHSNLSSWFYWASVNICKVVNKDIKKHIEKSTSLYENADIPIVERYQEEFFFDLGGVIEKLPTKKRDMLLMRFYEKKSYSEIGSYFKCKEDSVRMMIDRTILFIKKEVKRKDVVSSSILAHFFDNYSANTVMPMTNKFILQNSLLQQSFIKGVQKMYLITKLKVALIYACFLIPIIIPLSSHLFAENDKPISKQPDEIKNGGLSAADVNAITASALKYLAEKQAEDGSWNDTQYKSKNISTALSCFAFMAEGSRPRVGKYGNNLEKGLEYLLTTLQSNGVAPGEGSNPLGAMHEHILTSMVLLLCAQDMPWQPELKSNLTKSVALLSRSQKIDGGWSYDFSREGYSNLHMSSNVLWFMKTSNKLGVNFPVDLNKKGIDYVVKCAYPDGQFRYRFFGLPSINMNGLGIIALNNNGNLDHPLIGPAKNRILNDSKQSTIEDLKSRSNYLFDCFYDSMALYAIGDSDWNSWFAKTLELFKNMQKENGALYDEQNNTIYTTAIAAIILQAPNGKLPIYEKGNISPLKTTITVIEVESKIQK